MRETLFVVCAQTFAPLAGGLKINYTHLSPRLRQTQRKRNPSGTEWKKSGLHFSEFNCFATRCSLKCGAHYIAARASNTKAAER
jgi:hypothetical protein